MLRQVTVKINQGNKLHNYGINYFRKEFQMNNKLRV